MSKMSFAEYLRGKRVVLVGPAGSIAGMSQGKLIDSYDVVVRMKRATIPGEMQSDYGSKTNVLYVTMQRWMFDPNKDFGKWKAAGVTWVIMSRRKKTRHNYLVDLGVHKAFSYRRIPKVTYRRIRQGGGGTLPLAGNVCIGDLLRFEYRELYLTGFTYYRDPRFSTHYPGFQPPDVAAKWDDAHVLRAHNDPSPKSGSRHYTPPQVKYIAQLISNEPRCRVDPVFRRVIESVL